MCDEVGILPHPPKMSRKQEMFLEIVHGQNGFTVQPMYSQRPKVIMYKLVFEICFEKV